MNRASQTMRIDIPPNLNSKLPKAAPGKPTPSPVPNTPPKGLLGDTDFQALFHSVYDGAIITSMAGAVIDANPRASNFLQYSRDELRTLKLTDLISGTDTSTLTTIQEGIKKDRFILIQAYCLRKDKAIFPVEIAVNPLTVAGHEYLCCFIRDITWRRNAEETMKTIHVAIQNSATGIVIADLDGKISFANPAATQLLDESASLVGKSLKTWFDQPNVYQTLQSSITAGTTWSGEVLINSPSRPAINVQVTAAPNWNADDELSGMVLSLLDISDRIRAQEAEKNAERQNVMMESLGAACHHLGQPATVLLASLELMIRVKDSDKAMGDELLASSIEAAESLRKMLHNLNDITEYKTTPYIEGKNPEGRAESRILDVPTENND